MTTLESNASLIARLAALRGVGDTYRDYRGELRRTGLATQAGILRAMGFDPSDAGVLEAGIREAEIEHWRELLPPVIVSREGGLAEDVVANIPSDALDVMLRVALHPERGSPEVIEILPADCPELERGQHFGRDISRRRVPLPRALAPGYHRLEVEGGGGLRGRCTVIVAPARCHEPPALLAGRRLWGVAVQLYTLRSASNWGVGDFADLERVVRLAANAGADFVGLNPLHALFPARPASCSPYSPSSRHALNVLYIAVEQVPEFATCAEARRCVSDPGFQGRLAALRALTHVDYVGVAGVKLPVLELLHAQFLKSRTPQAHARREAFAAWRAERGEKLELHALFDALDEHLSTTNPALQGWQTWPKDYHDPAAAAVRAFAAGARRRVAFYAWLQWLADSQLAAVRTLCEQLGMAVGLYGDYAVGVSADGSETWSDQAVYRMQAGIGAPPDPLALKGQDWGIPPQDPHALAARGHAPFTALIRANMRHFGALRLDHVMALFRQWWVPRGLGATDGGYVHYPLDQLASVVALESRRVGCMVVGEDLGTVPPEVGQAMADYRLYHYRVMLFEKVFGGFRTPQDYPRNAIATISTHDLPTLRGWWEAADMRLRDRLNLFPDEAMRHLLADERNADREHLIDALAAAGVRPRWPVERYEPAFAAALHRFLGRTEAALAVVQAEDLIAMMDPVNVPGTSDEYPNWRRKLSVDVEGLFASEDARVVLEALQVERGGGRQA